MKRTEMRCFLTSTAVTTTATAQYLTMTGKELFFKFKIAENTLRFVGITEPPGVLLSDDFYYFAPCSPEAPLGVLDSSPVFLV